MGFLGIQILGQHALLPVVRQWQSPGWVKFFTVAGGMTLAVCGIVLLATEVLGRMLGEPPRALTLSGSLFSGAFFGGTWLLSWYGAWYVVLRAGWIDVPASLVAAGLHSTGFFGYSTLSPGDIGVWLWAIPLYFFAGWATMFLPGMVAAHECVPTSASGGSFGKRVVAGLAPAPLTLFLLYLCRS